MSFSSEVKTELAKHLGKSRHCQIAELAALIAFEGRIPAAESENRLLMQKYQLLLAELFHIEEIHTAEEARSVFSTVKMYNDATGEAEPEDTVKGLLIQQNCCKRAYIRGAFWREDRSAIPTNPTILRLYAAVSHRPNSFGM